MHHCGATTPPFVWMHRITTSTKWVIPNQLYASHILCTVCPRSSALNHDSKDIPENLWKCLFLPSWSTDSPGPPLQIRRKRKGIHPLLSTQWISGYFHLFLNGGPTYIQRRVVRIFIKKALNFQPSDASITSPFKTPFRTAQELTLSAHIIHKIYFLLKIHQMFPFPPFYIIISPTLARRAVLRWGGIVVLALILPSWGHFASLPFCPTGGFRCPFTLSPTGHRFP